MLTMRLGLAPDKPAYKKATLFFSLGLGLPAIIGSPLLTLSFENPWLDALRGTVSATSYLVSAYCFKYGYSLRSNRGFSKPSIVMIHIALFALAILSCSTSQLLTDSPFLRLNLIVTNIILVTVLMGYHIKKKKNAPSTFGERVTFIVIGFSIFTYCCYPFAMMWSQSKLQYLSFSLPLQVLQLHLWIIALLVLILSDVIDIYRKQAITDAMTGLSNRGHFFKTCSTLLESNTSGSLIYCDIDNFKRINDTFGHSGGDVVIIAFSELLKEIAHVDAVTARLGGEEFVSFLPNVPLKEAKTLANNLRIEAEKLNVINESKTISFTVSFGIATVKRTDQAQSYEEILDNALQEADIALYQAKGAGRNTVITQHMPTVVL